MFKVEKNTPRNHLNLANKVTLQSSEINVENSAFPPLISQFERIYFLKYDYNLDIYFIVVFNMS